MNELAVLNPLTLSFRGEYAVYEKKFLKDYLPGPTGKTRGVFLFGILAFQIFGILDAVLVPEKKAFFWILRYAVFTPLGLGLFSLTYLSIFKKIAQGVFVAMEMLGGIIIIIMVVSAPQPAGNFYYAGLILVFMMAYSALDMRFIWAALTGWFIVVMYEAAALLFTEISAKTLISNNFFFIGANIIGMFSAYNLEYAKRMQFVNFLLLEKERSVVKEYSENLEERVRERTLQLEINNERLIKENDRRRKAEDGLSRLLEEKEILLKELYHRTKNSLQIISSMLSLEILHSDQSRLREILKKTELKIYSMEMVHQKLFESGNLSALKLNEYLYDVILFVVQSYSGGIPVLSVSFDMDEIVCTMDTAIPCGLIVTELVSNTIHHAYPDKSGGALFVKLSSGPDNGLELVISDNGCGVSEGFNFSEKISLGLKTVFELAEYQLKGSAEFKNEDGISCIIRFKNIDQSVFL